MHYQSHENKIMFYFSVTLILATIGLVVQFSCFFRWGKEDGPVGCNSKL